MTKFDQQTFKVGQQIGFYGRPGTVKELYVKDSTYGIIISIPQKETEIRKKSKPREYLITDAKQVWREC